MIRPFEITQAFTLDPGQELPSVVYGQQYLPGYVELPEESCEALIARGLGRYASPDEA